MTSVYSDAKFTERNGQPLEATIYSIATLWSPVVQSAQINKLFF